jgi:sigma-B regulation protein RsbU (phosphoserine phosphatase)
MFGKDRVREVMRRHSAVTASEIGKALEASLADFLGQIQPQDDVTFVIIKLAGASERVSSNVPNES